MTAIRRWLARFAPTSDVLRDLSEVFWLFVTLRVVLSLFALILSSGENLAGPCHFEVGGSYWTAFPPLDNKGIAYPLIGVWQRWDGCWYTNIAANGYGFSPNAVSFWPLFPALTAVVGRILGGDMTLGGMVVNSIAYVIAMFGLLRLVTMDFDRRAASRTILCISVFPSALFLLAPFTEAVFLACSVWAIYAARRRRWVLAAFAGLLAGTARIQGVFLVLPIGWEAAVAWWSPEGGRPAPRAAEYVSWLVARLGSLLREWRQVALRAIAVGLPGVAFLAFIALSGALTGRTPLDAQDAWGGRSFHPPWEVFQAAWDWVGSHHEVVELVNLIALEGFCVLAIFGLFRLPLTYSLFAIPQVALIATRIQPTPLTSTTRLLLVAFPVFVMIALACRDRRIERAWLLISTMLMGYLTYLYLKGDFVA